MREVHVIVPESVRDPARPSGGNTYDRRICQGLAELGWAVYEHAVPGDWPRPGAAGHGALARAVRRIPDGARQGGEPRPTGPRPSAGHGVLVHRPAERGEPPADPAIECVATAWPRRVVDVRRDDYVDLGHSGRS